MTNCCHIVDLDDTAEVTEYVNSARSQEGILASCGYFSGASRPSNPPRAQPKPAGVSSERVLDERYDFADIIPAKSLEMAVAAEVDNMSWSERSIAQEKRSPDKRVYEKMPEFTNLHPPENLPPEIDIQRPDRESCSELLQIGGQSAEHTDVVFTKTRTSMISKASKSSAGSYITPGMALMQANKSRLKSCIAPKNLTKLAVGLVHVLLFFAALLIALVAGYGNYLGDEFMMFHDLPLRGHPGYLIDFLGGKCVFLKGTFGDRLLKLEESNKKLGWQEVVLLSRGDNQKTTALYFPTLTPSTSPLVILIHGITANNLDSSTQATAFYLREMNISSLVPNLRNHGGTGARAYGQARQIRTWHNQYLDVLGAWDYVVTDPDGQLGGPRDPRKVGLLGFEYGGFAVQAAFANEPRIWSMMLDGAVHDIPAMFTHFLDKQVSTSFAWLFRQQAWSRCESRANRNLDEDANIDEELVSRNAPGKVAIVHAANDLWVPSAQHEKLLQTLNRAAGIEVVQKWVPQVDVGTNCKERLELHLAKPQEYMRFLCGFWWTVFEMPGMAAYCAAWDTANP